MNRRQRKNKTLKALTWLAGCLFVLSACCLDSLSYIPMIVCSVCAGWLLLMYAANSR